MFVIRVVGFNGSRGIKIVDFIGDEKSIQGLTESWQELLRKYNSEHIDIYNVGLGDELMASSGFLKRTGNEGIIIPHYFEPFVRENIEVTYGVNTESEKPVMLFRGDGDQDRPQIIS